MKKSYDEFRALYDDVIEERNTNEKHFCPMYDDAIPNDIYYEGGDCPYYLERR
jgi:hypothetical protein